MEKGTKLARGGKEGGLVGGQRTLPQGGLEEGPGPRKGLLWG